MVRQTGKSKSGVVTGIEYGTSMVRVATVTLGRGGRVNIRSLSSAPVRPARPGVREDLREARIQALKEALSKHQRDLGCVIVGTSRDEVISRFVSLPSGESSEIREMLFFDVERHLPFSPDDAEISYRVAEQVGANESRVLMVASKRSDLYKLLDDLDSIGVQPDRIDVDVHGCGYAYARNGVGGGEPFAVLDLDLKTSLISLIIDNNLRFSRAVSVGVGALREGESPLPTLQTDPNDWSEEVHEWWRGLVRNIVRSLAGFAHEEFGNPPKKLILTGMGSKIDGIAEALQRELELPVIVAEPVESAKGAENVAAYSCAIGLALEEIEKEHHINLIPEEIYERYAAAHRKRFAVNTGFLLFINLLLIGGWVGHSFWHKQQLIRIYESKIALIQPKISDIEEIQEKQKVIAENMDFENSAFKVVSDVFLRTRDRIRIRQLVFKKSDAVDLDLELYEPQDRVDYVTDLTASPHFCGSIDSGRMTVHRWPKNYGDNLVTQDVSGFTAKLCTNKEFKE